MKAPNIAGSSVPFQSVGWRRSIASRATVLILVLGALVGVLVGAAGALLVEKEERARLDAKLGEQLLTVERAASVAAFAHDEHLAREVVSGLLHNRSIARAAIEGEAGELAAAGGEVPAAEPGLSRPLRSPFDDAELVGVLRVHPEHAAMHADARAYSRFIALLLAGMVVVITCGVAWVVSRHVTRPIRTLSDDLHRLDAEHGACLVTPTGHGRDEIGRLAGDINALIERMGAMIASERRTRALHEAAEHKWHLIFENAETGLFTLDADGRLSDWNPWLARMFDLPLHDDHAECYLLGDQLADPERRFDEMRRQIALGEPVQGGDFECRVALGGVRWVNVVLHPLEGRAGMLQGIMNDVTERRRAEALAQAQAERDVLTGLLNRRGVDKAYGELVTRQEDCSGLALLMLDLDGFKAVNDEHGHHAGDALLALVARRVEAVVRRTDVVARLGGDEFVVLLTRLDAISTARLIASKLVEALGQPFALDGVSRVTIGVSVGVAFTHCPPAQIGELLRRADGAMYEAKRAGKSQYRLALPG